MGSQLIEGKGVSRINGFRVPADMLTVIGVDTPHRSRAEHERFDERVLNVHANIADDHPHVVSMMEFGVFEPVLIEIEEVDGKDLLVVVDGRGRVLKQRIADRLLKAKGLPTKPVPVFASRKNDTIAKLGTALSVLLNEHRVEDTPMNRAMKAQYLIATGYTAEQVAGLFAVSEQTITDWVKLTDLVPAAQRAVESGAVSASAAVKLHGLGRDEQKTALEQLVASGGGKATVKKANAIVRGTKSGGGKPSEPPVVAPTKRAIKKAIENGKGLLSEDLILGMRIAIGDVTPNKVKHLAALLRGETPGDAE